MKTALLDIVIATNNEGKLVELRELLGDLPVRFLKVGEVLDEPFSVDEDGASFEENARKKARAACLATGLVAIADDSGLEVDALGGRPGVRSARFAHERATDAENNAFLLQQLQEVEAGARTARFRCALVLATPWEDEMQVVDGAVAGRIARTPRGNGGFGYDPLFVVDEAGDRAMAELSEAEKNALSHRGRAARALRPLVEVLLEQRLAEAERASG